MEIEELEQELEDSLEENQRLETRNTALEEENGELKYQIMHKDNNLETLQQEKETLEDEIEELERR